MKIELVLIASEILDGKITDLNGLWLAQFLQTQGEVIQESTVVRDDLASLTRVIGAAWSRADVVITSGGIGPTKDDLTKEVYQTLFKLPIEKSAQAREVAKKNYARFERDFDSKNNGYDLIPQGVVPLNNPRGLAPGLFLQREGKVLVSLPGVPHEFREMFEQEVFPKLSEMNPSKLTRGHFVVRTKLIPEEKIFGELCPTLWDELCQFGVVSSLPQTMGIDIGVSLTGKTQTEVQQKKALIKKIFEEGPLKKNIWQYGQLKIEELLVQTLKEKKMTVAAAESCTGGLCSSRLTDVSGSSEVFLGGLISYANEVKIQELSVNPLLLHQEGAVSEPVALQMATEARQKFSADFAFSLTGIAGPGGGSAEKPVGTVWIGIAGPRSSFARKFEFKGDRSQLKLRFSQMSFYLLLEEIQAQASQS